MPAVLIATARVRSGEEDAFRDWRLRHDAVVSKFPGYISSDIMPTGPKGGNEWTVVINFQTAEQLAAWQKSKERGEIVGEALRLFEGGTLGETVQTDGPGTKPGTDVTEVILSRIKPGMDDQYREWAIRIERAQSKYPGYRGTYLQPPSSGEGPWTTLLRYDTAAHLEAWLASPERARLIEESREFIESEELMRLATSFPGWVPINPETGEGPPNWKTALLVLLGLFPIVMLELRFLSPVLREWNLNSSLSTFIGNTLSVAATSFITMPLFVRCFGWWLFPEKEKAAQATAKGLAILGVLFALEVAALWRLLPW